MIVTDQEAVDYARVADRAQRVFDTRDATRQITQGAERFASTSRPFHGCPPKAASSQECDDR